MGVDAALNPAVEVLKEAGLFRRLIEKLVGDRDAAGEALAVVLGQIIGIGDWLTAEYERYIGLWFDPAQEARYNRRDRAVLKSFGVGPLRSRMRDAKIHCSKITTIYCRYLRDWFTRALDPEEFEDMAGLFNNLEDSDQMMVGAMEMAVHALSQEAAATLALVDNNQYAEANRRIRDAEDAITAKLTEMRTAIAELQRLRQEYRERTKTLA